MTGEITYNCWFLLSVKQTYQFEAPEYSVATLEGQNLSPYGGLNLVDLYKTNVLRELYAPYVKQPTCL